jgi:hypothetical protein
MQCARRLIERKFQFFLDLIKVYANVIFLYVMRELFGTDGIRGIANEYPITPEVALRIGRAVARVLKAQRSGRHKVVIGKDTRVSGYMLETALTSGLVSEGARVLLTGPCANSRRSSHHKVHGLRRWHYAHRFAQSLR